MKLGTSNFFERAKMLEVVEKTWNEFWAYYYRIEHRHNIPGIFDWDKNLVDFIETVCELKPSARVLDLACGGGDQAKLLSAKGYRVTGIDIAPCLVEFAKDIFAKEGLSGEFLVGDMRKIGYDSEFDACTLLSGSFGFFGDAEDLELLKSIRRSLVPGGYAFVMYLSPGARSNLTGRKVRSWCEMKDGWDLFENWFDEETKMYRGRTFIIRRDGTMIVPKSQPGYHADESIRCYSVEELKAMLNESDLEYIGNYSSKDFSRPKSRGPSASASDILLARRPIAGTACG
ncbi:MAG: class I SAM-dependent methyltransferase [Candidatus Coatesbacteria bacterium]|nr:class I SAM-dependent methyltransferase [Candidatus Coatesbacteria bacterium]